MSSDSDETFLTPQEITNMAEEATLTMLPEKSKNLYNKSYANFMQWRTEKRINSFSENVLLAYFQEMCAKFAPSTLWSQYSMLKSTLNTYEKQDVSKYSKLHSFLKRKSQGYKTKKSKTFTPSEINKFINEAPDILYLMTKAAVIFGVTGACRRQELHCLLFENVKDLNGAVLVNLLNTKNKTDRTFTITGKYYNLIKKYMDLRPAGCRNENFFIKYYNGKCSNQNIGINTLGNLGKTVASYLDLPNPELYTGHCFRRTSATLLIDAGGDITTLKGHCGWGSTAVAESYIDNSIQNKMKVSKTILNSIEEPPAQPSDVKPPPSATFTPLTNENINFNGLVQKIEEDTENYKKKHKLRLKKDVIPHKILHRGDLRKRKHSDTDTNEDKSPPPAKQSVVTEISESKGGVTKTYTHGPEEYNRDEFYQVPDPLIKEETIEETEDITEATLKIEFEEETEVTWKPKSDDKTFDPKNCPESEPQKDASDMTVEQFMRGCEIYLSPELAYYVKTQIKLPL